MALEFKLPDLGENIASGTVAKVLVAEGETIENEQAVLELETDKAVVEVPVDASGVIQEVLVKDGDEVKVGQTILTLKAESSETEEAKTPAEPPEKAAEKTADEKPEAEEPPPKSEPVASPAAPETTSEPKPKKVEVKTDEVAPAAPSTRRFAREIGININEVPGSGPGGRISIEDVKSYAKRLNTQKATGQSVLPGIEPEKLPDFQQWGEIERQSMSKIRQATAKHLSYAWVSIPHVTQFDKADVTELEKMRKEFGKTVEKAGGKLTVTAILIKIVEAALRKFPQFNASIDMETHEIIFKKYFNIGVAVDTEYGLLVPVIKNVDQKNIAQISVELGELAAKARERKLTVAEMQGGNFSISNLGGIGGSAFTPIVNAPEVAILGVSRSRIEGVFRDGQFEPRLMLPLSLSYDHRLIDGADGARFIRWIVEALEQPFKILIDG